MTLSKLKDTAGRALPKINIPMGILFCDVDGSKAVKKSDVNLVKAQVGTPLSLSNFTEDVNLDGSLTQADVTATQGQVGTSIP